VLGPATGNTDTQDSPRLGLGGSHHLPPYSILCDSPRDAHPNGFSLPRVPKSRHAGLPRLWSLITFQADLGSKCDLKKSCSSRPELSNGMSHVVCSQVFRVDSRLLMVGSQNWQTPESSTPGPSFGHNLCFRCPNEQCEPILDIYASRAFHWYKVSGVHRDSISQSGSCLGSVRVHSLTLSYIPGSPWCDSRASLWPAPLQPLCLGREPKARVATDNVQHMKMKSTFESFITNELIELLKDFKAVVTWTYKDLKGIPPKIVQHIIELDIVVSPIH
jgi:hypothetical protein